MITPHARTTSELPSNIRLGPTGYKVDRSVISYGSGYYKNCEGKKRSSVRKKRIQGETGSFTIKNHRIRTVVLVQLYEKVMNICYPIHGTYIIE